MTLEAAYADEAFRIGRRRRAARGLLDTAFDALLAIGGVIAANAVFSLHLGFPEGRAGISLGAAVLSLALAALTSTRRRSRQLRARIATPVPVYELPEAA